MFDLCDIERRGSPWVSERPLTIYLAHQSSVHHTDAGDNCLHLNGYRLGNHALLIILLIKTHSIDSRLFLRHNKSPTCAPTFL